MAKEDRWIFDKYNKEDYSKEEQIERYKKIIAYKKTVEIIPFKKGKILINNGVEQKFILKDLPIPDGWKRGAIK